MALLYLPAKHQFVALLSKADKHFTYCNESWQESPFRSALQSGQQRLLLSVERDAAHDFIVPV